jgi:hypothetical protein
MIMLLAILDLKGILFAPWPLLAVSVCGFSLSNQANVRILEIGHDSVLPNSTHNFIIIFPSYSTICRVKFCYNVSIVFTKI